MKKVSAIPAGFHTVTPHLVVDGADEFLEFVKKAFNGQVVGDVHRTPDNQVMHATVKIGDSMVMVADTMDDMKAERAMLYLYLENADNIYKQAIAAKAESIQEPRDEFYGDRTSAVKDRWGIKWWIATHIEDISSDELMRRAKAKAEEQAVAR
ncbi:MAG TPA: VOC family protein [Cyclobacteriaceae bacterium]|nr:VOC family protein [Cyclobacteriaceae bacterium]